jgi:hypothetical protein
MFLEQCIGKLNGFAWDQAIPSMGLSSIEETVLKKYLRSSCVNMDLSQDEHKKSEDLIAAALIGVLDNMLVDFKKQLRDQIVNCVYGQSKEVALQEFELLAKIS